MLIILTLFFGDARDKLAQQGNAPGFPQQFSYVQANLSRVMATPESVNIHVNGDTDIAQAAYRDPIVGPYNSEIPDIPWDPKYELETQQQLLAFGFGSAMFGMYLLGK